MTPTDDGDQDYLVALRSFSAELDGERIDVAEGERVIAGHPLLDGREDYFELDTRDLPRGVSTRQVASCHALVTAPEFPQNALRVSDVMAALTTARRA